MLRLRPMMNFVKEYFDNKPIIGAEVGVFRGEHACEILGGLSNVEKLYLIDPYEIYTGYNPRHRDEILLGPISAQRRLDKKGISPSRYEWIISPFSASVLSTKLDFIYIDGNHSYNAVRFDILESQKVVNRRGIIGGHDYRPNNGVFRAVNETYEKKYWFEETDWWTIHRMVSSSESDQ